MVYDNGIEHGAIKIHKIKRKTRWQVLQEAVLK